MELILDALVHFVTGSLFSDEFLFFDGFEVTDLDVRITVDSLGPDTVGDIEIQTDEIEHKRDKCHLGMSEKGNDYTDTDDDNSWKESNLSSDIGLERLED